jgi:uncharacterized membrane protein
MRNIGWILLCALSIGVAGYGVIVYAFLPLGAFVHPEIRPVFEAHPVGILAHVFAAALALLIGPFQFLARLRRALPALHRWLGRIYLGIGVLIGGVAGLYMAQHAFGGIVSRLGFASLALLWLYTGLKAWLAIRARDIAAHREWMIRNFALTFAAVTLRLYVPVAILSGLDFASAYAVIAWLCWVPNLIFAQWIVSRTASGNREWWARRTGIRG